MGQRKWGEACSVVNQRYKLTFYAGQDYGELFDLQDGPHELQNLWGCLEWDPTRNGLLRELLYQDTGKAPGIPDRIREPRMGAGGSSPTGTNPGARPYHRRGLNECLRANQN